MLIETLKQRFQAEIQSAEDVHGMVTIVVAHDRAHEVLQALRDEAAFEFNMLTDLTAVDWPDRKPRFDMIYQLNSLKNCHRLRVKVQVDGAEAWVPSAIDIWKSADWMERECWDMFGIEFRGHGDLRRILLYDSFVGHPLRKDYPYQHRQPIVPEIDPVIAPIRMSR
jgi:NADH-quinone oxidoreductase subunit C